MNIKVLVDSEEFWNSLREDSRAAKTTIYIQTLTLEGDTIGSSLAELLTTASCKDKRIIVASFSKWIINDRFLYWPNNFLDQELRAEARQTREMMCRLKQ